MSAGVFAGLVAGFTQRAAATAPRVQPLADVVIFAPSTLPPVGSTIATDLSQSGVFPEGSTSMVLRSIGSSLFVAGVSPTGSVLIACDPQLGARPKPASTPASLATLTGVAALSNVVSNGGTGAAIAVRSANGAVSLVTTTNAAQGPWVQTVLTSVVGGPGMTSVPELGRTADGRYEIFGTSAAGHVLQWTNDGLFGRTWNAYDLSAITGLAPVVGTPQLASAANDGDMQSLLVETVSHQLVLLVDDNTTYTMWRQIPLTLPAGAVPVGPPQLMATSSGLLAGAVTTSGAVVASAPSALGPWVWTDLSFALTKAKQLVSANSALALSPTTLYLRSTAGDLLAVTNFATSSTATVANVSSAVGVGERISSDPVLTMTPTGPALIASDGGSIPLVAKIVSLARSADQNHAAVVETPLNTNCNPYSGYFGRGSTWACPKGMGSEEWCSDFANWVWLRSGAQVSGITGYSYTFVTSGMRLGTFKPGATNNPKPGDAVVWGVAATGVGNHVGLVVAVKGNLIDVVAGNAGPATPQGYNVKVWESGFFDPALSSDTPTDSIVGYVTPIALGQSARASTPSAQPVSASDAAKIALQDHGR